MTGHRARAATVGAIAALLPSAFGLSACSASGWHSAPPPAVADPSVRAVAAAPYRVRTQPVHPAGFVSVPWKVAQIVGDRIYLANAEPRFCNVEPTYTLSADVDSVTIGAYERPLPADTICAAEFVARLGRPYVQVVGGVAGRRVLHAH